MKTLIVGATGRQGGAVVREMLQRGHEVLALTRDAAAPRATALRDIGAEVAQADVTDADRMTELLGSVDSAFAVTSPGGDLADDTEWRQGSAIAEAARAARLRHLVFGSATFSPTNRFLQKLRVEHHLGVLDLPWTVVAPTMFMDNVMSAFHVVERGEFRLPIRPEVPIQWICSDDIGTFAALALENRDRFLHQRVQIAAEELTGPEIAEVLSRVVGRPIAYVLQTLEEYEDAAGRRGLSGMDYWDANRFPVDIAHLRERFPEMTWTSFQAWAGRQSW